MSEQWPSKEQEIWFQAGVTGEQQRIIKLLEEQIPLCEPENPDADSCQRGDCGCAIEQGNIEDLIELIKGETK